MNIPDLLVKRTEKGPFRIGRVVFFRDTDTITKILRSPNFSKGGELWDVVTSLLGKDSVITAESRTAEERAKWAAARTRAALVLSEGVHLETAQRHAARLARKICRAATFQGFEGPVIDIRALALEYTGSVIVSAVAPNASPHLLGALWPLVDEAMRLLPRVMAAAMLPWPLRLLGGKRRFDSLCARITETLAEAGVKGTARDELVTLLVAGRDTTAAALTWLLLSNGKMSVYDTLQRYPPIWFLPRRCKERTELPNETLSPNDIAILLLYGVTPPTMLAFGAGERRCVGANVAVNMLEPFARHFFEYRRIRIVPTAPPEVSGGITLWPKNTKATVEFTESET